MKRILLALLLLCTTTQINAQSVLENLIRKGIEYHDNGNYDKAIETYKEALQTDPKSPLVNYEISLSYSAKGDLVNAVDYADRVLKLKSDFMIEAYMIKGSSLDDLGKSDEAIKVFKKAIKKTDGHYLLNFNLALSYYKLGDLDNAEASVTDAIELNPNHASSHFILANIHNYRGNVSQTMLAAHYFLLLEPNTDRSKDAYKMIQKHTGANVSTDANDAMTINIMLSPNGDSEFAAADLMVALLQASKAMDDNKDKTEDEMFIENTTSFFTVLGELKDENSKSMYWTLYTATFYELAKSDHMEAYCYFISQSGNDNSEKWMTDNEVKVTDFTTWISK